MHSRTLVCCVALTSASLSLATCGGSEFPVSPAPVVTSDVTTVGGGSWSGDVLLSDNALTSFNMTLIARSLGQEASPRRSGVRAVSATRAQTVGTTDVSGNFQTGIGVTGTVQGRLLTGTLKDGTFEGTLTTTSCSRAYSGPITESTVAWIARGPEPAGCPLTFSIQLPRRRGPGCQYIVSFSQQAFSGNGGGGSLDITTGPECAWAAESLDPWLRVDDGEPRLGSGGVTFAVLPNSQGSREGRLRVAVANQTFLVNQGPACTYAVSPATIAVDGSGGSGTAAVTTPAGCEWTTQSGASWISVTPPQGAGSGTVSYVIQGNAGPSRTGTFQAAGRTITVTQGESCGSTATPTSFLFNASGGSNAVTLDTPADCAWIAASQDNWIVLGSRSGTGPARLSFTVAASTGEQRTGSFTAAGQRVTISQLSGCTFTLTDTPDVPLGPGLLRSPMSSVATSGTLTVAASDRTCDWTLTVNVDWVSFDSMGTSAKGEGTKDVRYAVTTNGGGGAQRPGTLTLQGDGAVTITVTFTQASGTGTSDGVGTPGTGTSDGTTDFGSCPGCSPGSGPVVK